MECPNCKNDIPAKRDARAEKGVSVDPLDQKRSPAPEDAVRADRPPAPCPQCGWSTMWNE